MIGAMAQPRDNTATTHWFSYVVAVYSLRVFLMWQGLATDFRAKGCMGLGLYLDKVMLWVDQEQFLSHNRFHRYPALSTLRWRTIPVTAQLTVQVGGSQGGNLWHFTVTPRFGPGNQIQLRGIPAVDLGLQTVQTGPLKPPVGPTWKMCRSKSDSESTVPQKPKSKRKKRSALQSAPKLFYDGKEEW